MARKAGTMRKDGRYEVQKVIGHTIEGKPIRKSFYGKTKGKANAKYDKWVEQQARGETLTRTTSLSDWAMKWAATYKEPAVSAATYKNTYLNCINNYIVPFFGSARIADIGPADVQNFFNKHTDCSSAVLDKLKKVLNQIFESGIDNDLCYKNPCRTVKLPTYKKKVEKKAYTLEQAEMVLDYAKTHSYGIDIIILLKTGIRRGELLALRWSDFDFNNNLLQISRALTSTGEIGLTKTSAGVRVIPFDTELHNFLVSRQPDNKDRYVIESKTGNYMQQNNWDKRHRISFMDDMARHFNNAVPVLTAHELRHTFGTLLRARGVDIYTIQKVMGHSDIRVTADIYVHNDIEILKTAMQLD